MAILLATDEWKYQFTNFPKLNDHKNRLPCRIIRIKHKLIVIRRTINKNSQYLQLTYCREKIVH